MEEEHSRMGSEWEEIREHVLRRHKLMEGWPGTPGLERFLDAWKGYFNAVPVLREGKTPCPEVDVRSPAIQRDILNLCAAQEIEEFEDRSPARTAEVLEKEEDAIRAMEILAGEGTKEDRVGMGLATPSRTDEYLILDFTAVIRDPDWAGINRQWPSCRGLNIHVLVGMDSEPTMILAMPEGQRPWNIVGFPASRLSRLTMRIFEIALWHGALECHQHMDPEALGIRPVKPG